VVTGASRGIGRAIAAALAREGAVVAGCALHAEAEGAAPRGFLDELRPEPSTGAAPASFLGICDVRDAEQVARFRDEVLARLGPPDILVNNAGIVVRAALADLSEADWHDVLGANLTGTFLVTRAFLPHLPRRRERSAAGAPAAARIINIASIAGRQGTAMLSAYCAAKHGVVGLTRALALETATKGITVNAVCPSYTDTSMVRDAIANIIDKTGRSAAEAESELVKTNPQGCLIRPEQVAATVLWLCAPGAEAITGQAIAVAGGEVM
jgi:NAD(P)-dependent dehydrogenase (short-subunit alcohol dehydrogenase family)